MERRHDSTRSIDHGPSQKESRVRFKFKPLTLDEIEDSMAAQIILSVLLEAEKALAGGVITDPNQREELSQVCERLCLQLHSPTRRLDDLSYRVSFYSFSELVRADAYPSDSCLNLLL